MKNPWQQGLELFRSGRYFETHEEWEIAWKDAPKPERDFYQGMVHLTVALYQSGRDNQIAAHSQMRKARKRLSHYGATYRGIPLATLILAVEQAVERRLTGDRSCLDFGI